MAKRSRDGIVRVPVLPTTSTRTKLSVGPIDTGKILSARRSARKSAMLGGGESRMAGFGDVNTHFGDYSSLENLGSPHMLPELITGAEDFAGLSLLLRPPTERYPLYRHFWRTNPFVGRALDLLTQLPISKVRFAMPKGPDRKLNRQILGSIRRWAKRINLYSILMGGQLEKKLIGDAWLFCEWSERRKEWDNITILPPESVHPTPCQFSKKTVVEFKPDRTDADLVKKAEEQGIDSLEEEERRRVENIPHDIREMIISDEKIYLGTDPYKGSFVYQMSNSKEPYMSHGISVIERVINALITSERFKNTQLGLAGRNMTPKHIVSADSITPEQLEQLREEVDISFINPEYPIVVNFPVDYQLVGAQERLLDLSSENDALENQYMAGLGVTRELLVGEGIFSGNKITVEVINQMFVDDRDQWKDFVVEHLLKPMGKRLQLIFVRGQFFTAPFCPA